MKISATFFAIRLSGLRWNHLTDSLDAGRGGRL
jgi:hypothetical protein